MKLKSYFSGTVEAAMELARKELGDLLGCKVHLFLHVAVDERWADKREFYGDIGLDFDA